MELPRYATPSWLAKHELTVHANTIKRWAIDGHFMSPEGENYAIWIGGKLFIRWKEWVAHVDSRCESQQHLGAQSVPERRRVCRIKERVRPIGGSALKLKTGSELDNLLERLTRKKQKR